MICFYHEKYINFVVVNNASKLWHLLSNSDTALNVPNYMGIDMQIFGMSDDGASDAYYKNGLNHERSNSKYLAKTRTIYSIIQSSTIINDITCLILFNNTTYDMFRISDV